MAKSNFIVRGGANFNPLYQEFNKAQKKMNTFKSNMTKTQSGFQSGLMKTLKGVGVAVSLAAIGKVVKESTKAAMTVENSVLQIQRTMQGSASAFQNWAQTQSKAFGMAREEAYEYGATYSNLISTFANAAETQKYTTELLKASAVVASATGREMQDTMERIRSGLLGNTESIEDLGIHVNVAMLESTEAFKKFANGKSWQQLTYQEQQQIRLMSILEQANTKYGNSLAGTTQTKQLMFLATLKNIKLNLGQAFLPIYNVVLPALTSLASKIESITASLAAFTQALFGKAAAVQTKQTQAQAAAVTDLGDATEEAGKQAKGAMAPFDELNKLNSTDKASGVGGVGVNAEVPLLNQTDDGTGGLIGSIATKAQEMGEKIRKAFEPVGESFRKVKEALYDLGEAIKGNRHINDFFSTLKENLSNKLGNLGTGAIYALSGALQQVAGVINMVSGVLKGDFETGLKGVEQTVSGTFDIITGIVYPFFPEFAEKMQQFKDDFSEKWESLKGIVKQYGDPAKLEARDFAYYIRDELVRTWEEIKLKTAIKFAEIRFALAEAWLAIKTQIGTALIEIKENMSKVWEEIKTTTAQKWEEVKTDFMAMVEFIKTTFKTDWKGAWEGVKTVFKSVFDTLYGIAKAPLNLIISAINTVIDGLNSISIDIPDWVSKITGIKGTWGFDIPNIPQLANGGITNGPMLAMVGDNPGGREVVSPLEDLKSMIGEAVVDAMSAVMDSQRRYSSNSSGKPIILQVDGHELGRVVVDEINHITRISGDIPLII